MCYVLTLGRVFSDISQMASQSDTETQTDPMLICFLILHHLRDFAKSNKHIAQQRFWNCVPSVQQNSERHSSGLTHIEHNLFGFDTYLSLFLNFAHKTMVSHIGLLSVCDLPHTVRRYSKQSIMVANIIKVSDACMKQTSLISLHFSISDWSHSLLFPSHHRIFFLPD